jgi:hypothetical protein
MVVTFVCIFPLEEPAGLFPGVLEPAGFFPGVLEPAGFFPGVLEPAGLFTGVLEPFPAVLEPAGLFPGVLELAGLFPGFLGAVDCFGFFVTTSSSESVQGNRCSYNLAFGLMFNLTRIIENLASNSLFGSGRFFGYTPFA